MSISCSILEIKGKLYKVVRRKMKGYGGSIHHYTDWIELSQKETIEYYEVRSRSNKSK